MEKVKTVKRLVSFILSVALVATILPMGIFTATAAAGFAGGNGTKSDPYLVATKDHLNNVRNYLNAFFKMTADIVFDDTDFAEGGEFYNNGAGWAPIGNSYMNKFTGTFDGNGHVIKGLYIHYENLDDYDNLVFGLFGYLDAATVKNLGMVDTDIKVATESDTVGAIAGYLNNGTIENCYNTGNISSYYMTGGIVGAGEGTLSYCYNTGNVSCLQGRVGGIASHFIGTVKNCYNNGNVSASDELSYTAGGIVGEMHGGTVSDCYNSGNVSVVTHMDAYAGGIIGSGENITLSLCYNVGNVSAEGSEAYAGGIVGYAYRSLTVSSCYFADGISNGVGNITNTGSVKCTLAEMKNKATFNGFDFNKNWFIDGNGDYKFPQLKVKEIEIKLQSIKITKTPNKLTYTEGESFDKNGMKVTAYYSDGSNKEITDYTVSGYTSTPGTKTITVAYNGKTATFTVEVEEKVISVPETSSEPPVSSTEPAASSEVTSSAVSEPPASSEVASSESESSVTPESSDVPPAPAGFDWYLIAIIIGAAVAVAVVAVIFAKKKK